MENDKHVACEVPIANNLKDCWKIIEVAESTKKHSMMMENCCFNNEELWLLNMIDKGVGTLDLILKSALNKNLSLGFSAKNLLNPTIERFQDIQDVTVISYKKGVDVKLSLSYNF